MAITSIRAATATDLLRLNAIEGQADELFASVLSTESWQPAPSGSERALLAGFILVASEHFGTEAIGFVHVLDIEGGGHLEQLSVRPSAARRGHGRALIEAAKRVAALRGYGRLPGIRLRRRLFWRYTATWTQPA